MPRYSVTGPLGVECVDYGHVTAATPLEALRRVHVDALGPAAVQIAAGGLVFADPDVQVMCAGSWCVVEFRRGGNVPHTLAIVPPLAAAASWRTRR